MADFCPANMETISYAQAAELIGVKPQTLKQYAMDKSFPKIPLNAKVVRIPKEAFLEWAMSGGVKKATKSFAKAYRNKGGKHHEA